jgi:hypothetical protein
MELKKSGYIFKLNNGIDFELFSSDGMLQLLKNNGVPILPLCNRAAIWGEPKTEILTKNGTDIITFRMASNSLFENPKVVLECKDDFIEFYFKGIVKRRMSLSRWEILPKGSELKAIECIDFRSHINSPAAYEVHQTILGRRKLGTHGLDANTEDGDLMFAPHPLMFVFKHLENSLIIAPMELVSAESMHIKMIKGSTIIDDFSVRIGDNIYWFEEGERLESAHFMITMPHTEDVFESVANYTNLLVREGKVKPKTREQMQDWWFGPMWCSWGDQHFVLDSDIGISTAYVAEERAKAVDRITPELLDRVVNVIEENELPIRTLILDDRWYTKQGDMVADTKKFPNMRATVDRLHSKGFKVICWASLYQFEKDCEIFKNHPEWFLIFQYCRNPHNTDTNIIFIDYSDENVQREYVNGLLTRLLSDKEGCYNFDGIKFDWPFLCPHDYPFSNRDWVGKEKTIYNCQKVLYDAAKAIKSDSLIIGVSPHPFFNDTQDIIRTYDVSTYDIRIHLDRAKYVRAIAPGMVPAMDEHVYYQNFFRYIEEGSRLGIPMIYNLLRFNGDGHLYSKDDYRRLKKLLDDYMKKIPLRTKRS